MAARRGADFCDEEGLRSDDKDESALGLVVWVTVCFTGFAEKAYCHLTA
jgi:hypothetical protein